MPPKKASVKTKDELLRIWTRVDKDNNGKITVTEVLAQTKLLETELPDFIANWEKIAVAGAVPRQAFLDFCMGVTSPSGKSAAEVAVEQECDLLKLKELFDEIVQGRAGPKELRVADLVEHKARFKAAFPRLLENFSSADLTGTGTLSWDELRVFASGTDDWLEFQFDQIVGLETLKDQLRQFHRSVVLDKKRREAGHDVKSGGKYHMIFQGNPGTGKTTVARLVAKLLNRISIIGSDLLVEVQRDRLVAEYVGQTGPKTQAVIEEAKNGVLFIDEAYRLSQGSKNDFGKEAIEQLMGAMNESPGKAPVMVFAGYPDDMEEFMKANSGLYRRIAYTFDFTDYTPTDLAQILEGSAKSAGFCLETSIAGEAGRPTLGALIEAHTLPEARAMMNGGLCERIFTFAKQALDAREAAKGMKSPSVELTQKDILEACSRIPPPPPREARVAGGGDPSPTGGGGGGGGAAEAENARLRAEVAALQKIAAAGGGDPATAVALGRAEGRAAAAEAEAKRLQDELRDANARLAAAADGSGVASAALGKAEGRASAAEAEVQRLRLELEGAARRFATASVGGGAATVALAKAETRVAEAEGEVSRLRLELNEVKLELEAAKKAAEDAKASATADPKGPDPPALDGVVHPPDKYEVVPCAAYSCGCLWFYTKVIAAFLWKWSCIIAAFLWKWLCILLKWLGEQLGACCRFLQAKISGKEPEKPAASLPAPDPIGGGGPGPGP